MNLAGMDKKIYILQAFLESTLNFHCFCKLLILCHFLLMFSNSVSGEMNIFSVKNLSF